MNEKYCLKCDSNISLSIEEYRDLKQVLVDVLFYNLKDDYADLELKDILNLNNKEFKLSDQQLNTIKKTIYNIIHLENMNVIASNMANEMHKIIDEDILEKVFDEATYNETNKKFSEELNKK